MDERGSAIPILVFLISIAIFGFIYMGANNVKLEFDNDINDSLPVGYEDTMGTINWIWAMLPAIFLIFIIFELFLQIQKRRFQEVSG